MDIPNLCPECGVRFVHIRGYVKHLFQEHDMNPFGEGEWMPLYVYLELKK